MEMKNLNAKLTETLKERDWFQRLRVFNTSQDAIFPPQNVRSFFMTKNGIDEQSLRFNHSFGMFGMCNVDLSTSPQPKEPSLIQETSLLLLNNFLLNTECLRVQNNQY